MPAQGVQAAADDHDLDSPETYIGYERAANFSSPGGAVQNASADYRLPPALGLNDWGLAGDWRVRCAVRESAAPRRPHRLSLPCARPAPRAGSEADGKPVHFVIRIDGAAPGDAHGSDVAPDGNGVVTAERLYQLVRQRGPVTDHTFEIEFLDRGVQAYSFTFG